MRRTPASCSPATSRWPATSSNGTAARWRSSSAMPSWPSGERPTAHEDDAERAVRAALDLVDAVKALGPGVQARAGVLTGEAAVTLGAVDQGMVAGDLVNTASRLQSVAPPGAVLVGEATHRSASRAIAFEPAGEQLLKGKASPVPAWRAVRAVAQVGGRNRADTLEAAVRGPRRGAAPPARPLPRHRAREAGTARVRDRARRHRQDPPRVGVPDLHGRPRRPRLVAQRPLAGVRRRHQLLGPRRDGPRPLRPAGDRRRGHDPGQGRRRPRRARAGPRGARAGSSRPCWPCWG